jgi:hypothetical protein
MTNNEARYMLKCNKDDAVTVITRGDLETYWDANPQRYGCGPCRECGRAGVVKVISVKKGKRACGSWCTEGTGRSCTCVCEGRSHGERFSHTGALFYAS